MNETVIWDAGGDRLSHLATPKEYEGSWRHWVFTKNANTGEMGIYLDGELWASTTGQNSNLGEITNVALGNSVIGDNGYIGAIDEVRVYSQALSSEEVTTLHNSYNEKTGYNVWLESFDGIEPDSTNTGINEDFDSDGIPNLLEYVLASDPTDSITSHYTLPGIVFSEEAGEYVFRYTRSIDALNNTIQNFQYSFDLDVWQTVDITRAIESKIEVLNLPNNLQQVDVLLQSTGIAENGSVLGRLEVFLDAD